MVDKSQSLNAAAVWMPGPDGLTPVYPGAGTSPANVADPGDNPVKVAGIANSGAGLTTAADGQRQVVWVGPRGAVMTGTGVSSGIADGATTVTIPISSDGLTRPLAIANMYWNGTSLFYTRGDATGTWAHPPTNTVSSALSGTITTSGTTVGIAFVNSARQEVINPSSATLWASWGTPAVNGAGSFPILPNSTFSTDRTAGTLTLLSTAASQPYTVNRYS